MEPVLICNTGKWLDKLIETIKSSLDNFHYEDYFECPIVNEAC